MKLRSRPLIPRRRRVYLGCEGESERGYGVLLARLLDQRRKDVHIHLDLLRPGGGDPLALVELAVQRISDDKRKRDRRDPFVVRAILLDADRRGEVPERDVRLQKLATTAGLLLIWQEPCHEALLLRHLDGCRDRRPLSTESACRELDRFWPGSGKGMSAQRLAERIDESAVRQAAEVESELAKFLTDIGFL
jgi:hypothetical protein